MSVYIYTKSSTLKLQDGGWRVCAAPGASKKSMIVFVLHIEQKRLKRRNTLGYLDQYAAQSSKYARPPNPSQPPI